MAKDKTGKARRKRKPQSEETKRKNSETNLATWARKKKEREASK